MVGPQNDDRTSVDLLEHGRFVRNLAWRLLHDEDAAEEVVQETMLAAVKSKPTRDRPIRPWLATVARNVIRRRFRTQSRVRRREEAAAKPEAQPSTADMVARAEMLKQVVDAVLSLDEPNRTAVLLRFYEDLPPREIAAREGVGVETIRGRIKRAIQQLRKRLDRRHPEGRAGWAPILAGLCGLEVPAELVSSGGGAAAGTAASSAEAAPALALPAMAAAFLLGVGLTGLGIWQAFGSPRSIDVQPAGLPSVLDAGTASRGADATGATTQRGGGTADAAVGGPAPSADDPARWARENAALEERAAGLRAEIASLAPPPVDPEAFRFALPEHAPAFDRAGWDKLARAMLAMSELLQKVKAHVLETHESPPTALRAALERHNRPLSALALKLGPELGVSNPNQAYTHPAVVANLVRAALVLAKDPLSREQEIALQALGDAWAGEIERVEAAFAPEAPRLARDLAGGEAKLRFLSALKGLLTQSQYDFLFHPTTEGCVQLDLLAPGWDFMLRQFVAGNDRATVESDLLSLLFEVAEIERDDLEPYAWVGREWVRAIPGASEPQSPLHELIAFPQVEHVLAIVRAEVAAIEGIAGMGGLTEDEEQRLRAVSLILVPRIRVEAEIAPPPDEGGEEARDGE